MGLRAGQCDWLGSFLPSISATDTTQTGPFVDGAVDLSEHWFCGQDFWGALRVKYTITDRPWAFQSHHQTFGKPRSFSEPRFLFCKMGETPVS